MAYCARCGVEVDDRLDACPLCDTPIPEEVRTRPGDPDYPEDVIPPKPMYRSLTQSRKRLLICGLTGFFGLFPVALTTFLDLNRNGAVTWSFYVTVPVVAVATIVWIVAHYPKRPRVYVPAGSVVLFVMRQLIGVWSGEPVGHRSPVTPYFLISFLAIEFLVIFVTPPSRRRHPLDVIAAVLLDAALLVVGIDLLLDGGVSWSLIVLSSLAPPAVVALYLRRVRRRGLNVPGFIACTVEVLLLAVDLSSGGGLSWSLITALIFVPLGILFYVLHITLFDDTDWRKALHL